MGWGKMPSLTPYTQEIPHPVPWPRFPLQAKGLYFPRCLGAKKQLGLAPPLEVKNDSHPNCTLETKQGES